MFIVGSPAGILFKNSEKRWGSESVRYS